MARPGQMEKCPVRLAGALPGCNQAQRVATASPLAGIKLGMLQGKNEC